jgi:glycosyltransferase involved in cell wall biosynthesis
LSADNPRPYRLAIVASHVIQYQAPFFRLLAREPDLDISVFYCSPRGAEPYHDVEMKTTLRWDVDLLSGYHHVFLRNLGHGSGYSRAINPGIVSRLLRGHYDSVVLFLGWGTVTSLLAMASCRLAGIPFLLYGDSSYPPPADTLARRIRHFALRRIFRRASGFLVSGRLNADYYRHYGADPLRFFLVPWATDNERFQAGSHLAPTERQALRARLGIRPGQMVVIFSAKLLPRKDPMALLEAVEQMRHRADTAVVFLGEGALRGSLEQFALANGIQAHFAGFLNQRELPRHYAIGDVFVLPSIVEPRGAVINEAMACGLPLVVTDRCGSIGDVVLEGDNAFIYPAGDAKALAEYLDVLVEQPAIRSRMAQRSREIIADWDYSRGVKGVREAIRRLARDVT